MNLNLLESVEKIGINRLARSHGKWSSLFSGEFSVCSNLPRFCIKLNFKYHQNRALTEIEKRRDTYFFLSLLVLYLHLEFRLPGALINYIHFQSYMRKRLVTMFIFNISQIRNILLWGELLNTAAC